MPQVFALLILSLHRLHLLLSTTLETFLTGLNKSTKILSTEVNASPASLAVRVALASVLFLYTAMSETKVGQGDGAIDPKLLPVFSYTSPKGLSWNAENICNFSIA
jgi:hypothetical protein